MGRSRERGQIRLIWIHKFFTNFAIDHWNEWNQLSTERVCQQIGWGGSGVHHNGWIRSRPASYWISKVCALTWSRASRENVQDLYFASLEAIM